MKQIAPFIQDIFEKEDFNMEDFFRLTGSLSVSLYRHFFKMVLENGISPEEIKKEILNEMKRITKTIIEETLHD